MSKSDGFKRFYHQVSTLHSLFTVLISYLHQIYIVSLIYNTLRRRHHIIKRCSIFFFICSSLVTSLLFLLICPILFDIETLSSEVSSFIRKHLVARADHGTTVENTVFCRAPFPVVVMFAADPVIYGLKQFWDVYEVNVFLRC